MDGTVSVIVPTHSDRDVADLIQSIKESTYHKIELVIVKEGYERSKQRNIGYARSTGEYLLFLDSDMTIHPELIHNCVMLSDMFDGLYIIEIIVNYPVKTFFRSFYTRSRIDAVRFVKRENFIPFDENITGFEDWDFDRLFKGRKGTAWYPLYHYSKTNLKKKLFYYMRWLPRYIRKHPSSLLYDLNLFYRLWLCIKH